MSVYSVLKHRATVRRSTRTFETGQAAYAWSTVGEDVPVLLNARKREKSAESEFEPADRVGLLLSGPDADLRPGDRLVMTRGPEGTFVLEDDPSGIPTLHGFSHREFHVTEVG